VSPFRQDIPPYVAKILRSFDPDLKRSIRAAVRASINNPECGDPFQRELEGLRKYRADAFESFTSSIATHG